MDYKVLSKNDDCTICLIDDIELISPQGYKDIECEHYLCAECWKNIAKHKPLCPICRRNITLWLKEIMKFDVCTEIPYSIGLSAGYGNISPAMPAQRGTIDIDLRDRIGARNAQIGTIGAVLPACHMPPYRFRGDSVYVQGPIMQLMERVRFYSNSRSSTFTISIFVDFKGDKSIIREPIQEQTLRANIISEILYISQIAGRVSRSGSIAGIRSDSTRTIIDASINKIRSISGKKTSFYMKKPKNNRKFKYNKRRYNSGR